MCKWKCTLAHVFIHPASLCLWLVHLIHLYVSFPGGSVGKESAWPRIDPWRRKWQPIPVFLPGEFYGQRSLVGLQSMGSKRVGHNWVTNTFTFIFQTYGNYWYVWFYYHFLTCFFLLIVGLFFLLYFLPRKVPLAFVVKLVWWYWILTFVCL